MYPTLMSLALTPVLSPAWAPADPAVTRPVATIAMIESAPTTA
jgi:hypothetical protein